MCYDKENYITARNNTEIWKSHPNYSILKEYEKYIQGSVLDVGCNHGCSTYWLHEFNISKITGIDINEESLICARKNFKDLNIPNDFISLDLTKDNINQKYDTIISFHTLEHIYPNDIKFFLDNLYNSLNDGGYFIISIPYEKAYLDPCHVGFYNVENLTEILILSNFKKIECFKDDRWEIKDLLTGLFKK
jgi:2-polyprenyl-3-methyl-5-hydroxy-6-metoxy-1,4-benzoquinol methylase